MQDIKYLARGCPPRGWHLLIQVPRLTHLHKERPDLDCQGLHPWSVWARGHVHGCKMLGLKGVSVAEAPTVLAVNPYQTVAQAHLPFRDDCLGQNSWTDGCPQRHALSCMESR